jgi:hypothetical protein
MKSKSRKRQRLKATALSSPGEDQHSNNQEPSLTLSSAEFQIPPRTEWFHRILAALVREYAKSPEELIPGCPHVGITFRRTLISAGMIPEGGLPGTLEDWKWFHIEAHKVLDELIGLGFIEWDYGWNTYRPIA